MSGEEKEQPLSERIAACRQRAAAAEEMARDAASEDMRTAFLEVAHSWLELAAAVERLQPESERVSAVRIPRSYGGP